MSIPRTTKDFDYPLTYAQIDRLLQPVAANRLEGKNGLTYVPQQEVRAELTRVFGPGNWDSAVHDVTLLYDRELHQGDTGFPKNPKGDTYYIVGYRLACTLRVRAYDGREVATFTEYHAEENAPLPNRGEAHAFALTSAESYALRRAAIGLGDAFGLHLYAKGSTEPLIRWTLAQGEVYPDEHLAARRHAEAAQSAAAAKVGTAFKKPGQTTREPATAQPDREQGEDWGVSEESASGS